MKSTNFATKIFSSQIFFFIALFFCLTLIISPLDVNAGINIVQNPRTLVLFSSPSFKSDYSEVLADLTNRQHRLTFINPYFDAVKLLNYDRNNYENVLVFSSALPNSLPNFPAAQEFIDFVSNGGSLFIAPDNGQLSSIFRQVGETFGVVYFPSSASLIDTAQPESSFIRTPRLQNTAGAILGEESVDQKPLIFLGTPMTSVDNVPYVKRVVAATQTTIVMDNNKILAQGRAISLLSVVQLKNNARVLFLSDISMLRNDMLFLENNNNNKQLLHSVCWAVHDCGHVRVANLQHHLFEPTAEIRAVNPYINKHIQQLTSPSKEIDTQINPPHYKVGDNIHVDLFLQEYNGATKQWEYITSPDIIVDLTMLHPYVRFPLQIMSPRVQKAQELSSYAKTNISQFNHATELTLPDTMGVYKLSFNTYQTFPNANSQGYSFLSCEAETPVVIPVRPFEHDQWARFLFPAYPYYLSMLVTMGLFFAFSVLFLYTK